MVEIAYYIFAIAVAIIVHVYNVVPAMDKLAAMNLKPIPNTLKFRRTAYAVFFCLSLVFAPVLFLLTIVLPQADKTFIDTLVESLK